MSNEPLARKQAYAWLALVVIGTYAAVALILWAVDALGG